MTIGSANDVWVCSLFQALMQSAAVDAESCRHLYEKVAFSHASD